MSIRDIATVVAPPEVPSERPASPDWKSVEKNLELRLPTDYKEFIDAYGSGLLGNLIIVANPFSEELGIRLASVISTLCDELRERKQRRGEKGVPYKIYPDSPGLLPWGGDENGNGLYWLTEGRPNDWRCIAGAGREVIWQQFDMPMTSFLAKALTGEIKCRIWPANFAESEVRRTFKPY